MTMCCFLLCARASLGICGYDVLVGADGKRAGAPKLFTTHTVLACTKQLTQPLILTPSPTIQDVRRLVVAMSRARLGLYVFGRFELFNNCFELQPTFSQLAQRPLKLQVLPDERWGEVERAVEDRGSGVKTIGMCGDWYHWECVRRKTWCICHGTP